MLASPHSAAAYCARGRTLAAVGRLEQAVGDLSHAIELGEPSARFERGLALLLSGDNAAAIPDLTQPTTARGHAALGLCLAAVGDSREAAAELEAGLALDDTMISGWLGLSAVYRDIGDPDGDPGAALAPLEALLERWPNYPAAIQVPRLQLPRCC